MAYLALAFFLALQLTSAQGLSDERFYDSRCPAALPTVKRLVEDGIATDPRLGASLLRLHFHDCFVNGCDASVLLDDTPTMQGEKGAPPNINSLRGFETIDTIKEEMEKSCPGIVSCADILSLAARDSVVTLGGPSWTVQLGRRDSLKPNFTGALFDIPGPFRNLTGLVDMFARKGFTAAEMVALSGAHTIGSARCRFFRSRIYNQSATIDPGFASALRGTCPAVGHDDNLSPLDFSGPAKFDNGYFNDLIANKTLLVSDQTLFQGGSSDAQVLSYSKDQKAFFKDFANAMVKMGGMSPLLGTDGEVRKNCHRTNG